MPESSVEPSSYGLLVILPDALRQGLVPATGQRLARLGLYPTAARSVVMGQHDYDVLYADLARSKGSASGRRYGPPLTCALFELDNSLAVLLRGAVGTDVPQMLHDVKGPSSYLLRRPDGLRMISPLEDRCMSLIHTPDDWRQTVQHAEHFFPAAALKAAEFATSDLGWSLLDHCRNYLGPQDARSRYEVAVRLLARVIAVARVHTEFGDDVQDATSALARIEAWLAEPPAEGQEEHERFLSLMASLAALRLHTGLGVTVDSEHLGLLIRALSGTDDYAYPALDGVFGALNALSLRLTDWESHWLRVLMAFLHD